MPRTLPPLALVLAPLAALGAAVPAGHLYPELLTLLGAQVAAVTAAAFVAARAQGRAAARAEAQAQAERRAACHDPLTGLLNRRGLELEFEGWVRQGREVGLVFVDLDGFKAVNDRWGHAAGDALLAQAARRLEVAFGPDARLARVGGDEFVALAPSADGGRLQAMGDGVALLMGLPFDADGTVLSAISASLGAAPRQRDEPLAALMAQADAALLRAKAAGKRRCVVNDERQAANADRPLDRATETPVTLAEAA